MSYKRDLALTAVVGLALLPALACSKAGSSRGDAGQSAGAGGGGAGQSGAQGVGGGGSTGGQGGSGGSGAPGGSGARGGASGGAAGTGGSGGRGGAGGSSGSGARGGSSGAAGAGGANPRGGASGAGTAGSGARGGTTGTAGAGGAAVGPLRVDTVNPRYFTDGSGKAIYLTGSHTWGNFKDRAHVDPPPAFNYTAFLDFLAAHHHNFFRLWTWEQPHSFDDDPNNLLYFAQFPYQRTGPGNASDGKPKFDLTKLDTTYFSRMHDRIAAAGARGIYVSVMLFDGWDLVNAWNPSSGGFPMGSGNNVNSVATTGATAITLSDSSITSRQEAYVRAVVDAVNDLDNVLYEIANETDPSGVPWQYHFVDFVKSYEAGKPTQHPVGMTSTYPGTDSDLYGSHADWISPVGKLVAGDGRKVVVNDTDHSYGWQSLQSDGTAAQRAWAWETLCIGAMPLFMDPYLETWAGRNSPSGSTPDPAWNPLRDALGRTRLYADRLNLERTLPSTTLCSTGYCLADPGHQYLVYQPGSGAFTLTVTAATYSVEWYNPSTGVVASTASMAIPAEKHAFTPPFSGDAVLLLQGP
jgi:hypothetical protein